MKNNRPMIYLVITLLFLSVLLFGNTIYIHAKAQLAQHLIAKAWDKTQSNNHSSRIVNPVKPWHWADTYPVAKLTAPKQQRQYYVLAGATGSPLAFAPGLYAGTSLPGISQANTADTVIAGHHNTHFDFLKHLNVGEAIQLENHLGQVIHYRIDTIRTMDIRQQKMPVSFQQNRLTLVTCTPRFVGEVNPQKRLVVTALQQPAH